MPLRKKAVPASVQACTCGHGNFGPYTASPRISAYPSLPQMWVCAKCGYPSRTVARKYNRRAGVKPLRKKGG